jgi:hypothetical protein
MRVAPAETVLLNNITPTNLSDREMKVINILAQCKAAYMYSLNIWPNEQKGLRKLRTLLKWGILWSYFLGEKKIVTLSPISETIAGAKAYIPGDPREVLKIVKASDLFIQALSKTPCTFENADYPLQGILKIGTVSAGVIVLLKGERVLSHPNMNCLVICEDEDHILGTAESLTFPVLFTTLNDIERKDISDAFRIYKGGSLLPIKLNIFDNAT